MTALTGYFTETASSTVATSDTILENASTSTSFSNKNSNLTSGTTGWIEIWSQGNASAQTGTGSQVAPTGRGWCDDNTTLVGNHFQAGTWTFTLGFECTTTGTFVADVHFRAYQRSSGGVYTLICEAVQSGQTIVSTSYTVLNTSVSASASNTFVSGDKLYVDVTFNITTNGTTGNMRMQASSSATVGWTSAQVVTPGYISSTLINKDLQVRGRIQQLVTKDLQTRGRIQALTTKDLKIRANVGLTSKRDLQVRGRIQGLITHDLQVRGRIQQLVNKDLQTRGRIQQLVDRDLQVRGRVKQLVNKDLQTRGRVKQLVNKDLQIRGRIPPSVFRDLQIRGNISGPPILSGGFTLFGNGSGTITYDSFRATQYPDPSLSLSPLGSVSTLPAVQLANDTMFRINSSPGFGFGTDLQAYTQVGTGTTALVSDEAQISNTTGSVHMLYGTKTYDSENALVRFQITTVGMSAGLEIRYVDANNLYRLVAAQNSLSIVSVIAGVQTTLASASPLLAINTWYWMRFLATSLNVPGSLFGRVWQESFTEPSTWTVYV